MKLLCLDPSSSCLGYACFVAGKLTEAGRITPARCRDSANERIHRMRIELGELIRDFAPDKIVIEDTSGKIGKKRHGGSGAGLSVYGKALGYIWATCEWYMPSSAVEMVPENTWTRGVGKAARIAAMQRDVPSYDAAQDPGGDVADAIGLGMWWFMEQKIRAAS